MYGLEMNYVRRYWFSCSLFVRQWPNPVQKLQCNDFNRGHPRFFNQSQTDSLTKNFDFVVFKSQWNSILNLTLSNSANFLLIFKNFLVLAQAHFSNWYYINFGWAIFKAMTFCKFRWFTTSILLLRNDSLNSRLTLKIIKRKKIKQNKRNNKGNTGLFSCRNFCFWFWRKGDWDLSYYYDCSVQ